MDHGMQVVEVVGACTLLDTAGQERTYWRRDGSSLKPGFYVVHWPRGAATGRFNEDALFEGPFGQRGMAELGLRRILDLILRGDPWAECGPGRHPEPPIADDHLTLHRRPT